MVLHTLCCFKVWSHVVGKFNDRQALGTREITAETQEVKIFCLGGEKSVHLPELQVQPNGKLHTKYQLGDYKWQTFRQWGDR